MCEGGRRSHPEAQRASGDEKRYSDGFGDKRLCDRLSHSRIAREAQSKTARIKRVVDTLWICDERYTSVATKQQRTPVACRIRANINLVSKAAGGLACDKNADIALQSTDQDWGAIASSYIMA
jgi:hypothetical protein